MRTLSTHPGSFVTVAVTGDISIMEIAAPCEIFGVSRTEIADPWYEFNVCTAREMAAFEDADTIIIPGLQGPVEKSPPPQLVNAVRQAYQTGTRIVSIGTGTFVLAEAGILDGRRATTHWMHSGTLAARYPAVKVESDVLYTDEDDILTAAGMAASVDLCLHIVQADYGSAVANALTRQLVMPPHRDGGHVQVIASPAAGSMDHVVSETQSWVIAHLDQPLTVSDMARRAGLSTRSLQRHLKASTGKTPLQWLLVQRVHKAQELLERTDYTMERIAAESGMSTAATLRRQFRQIAGTSPDGYRRAFRDRTGR
jgi:transcriptional regulator GlxA family with amidase domain